MSSTRCIRFSTSRGNDYIYDDDTGFVFPCIDGDKNSEDTNDNKMSAAFKERLNKQYISNIPKDEPPPEITEDLIRHHVYHNGFKHLILHMTNECNLRCKYCVHSDKYPIFSDYSAERMSMATAQKGIDLYFKGFEKVKMSNPFRFPIIAFYGGEPLLEFNLIKECIEYINDNYSENNGKPIFSISTNGTLLTEEKADFFHENDVSVAISIDGPKDEHDRNRVFADGRGTFKTIMKNLRTIEEKYPDFLNHCVTMVTMDLSTDILKVANFVEECQRLPKSLRTSMVNPLFTTYYEKFNDSDRHATLEKIALMEKRYISDLKCGDISKLPFSIFGQGDMLLNCRPVINHGHYPLMPYTGSCVPGDKISVHPDGTIHICERINDKFSIGNVDKGIDFQKIAALLKMYSENVTKKCKDCTIRRLCDVCMAQCAGNGSLVDPYGDCESKKQDAIKKLSRVYSLLEEDPLFLERITPSYYRNIEKRLGLLEGVY